MKVQAAARGRQGRVRVSELRGEREAAAVKVQAAARGRQGRVRVSELRGERDAAVRIQCAQRAHVARRQVSELRALPSPTQSGGDSYAASCSISVDGAMHTILGKFAVASSTTTLLVTDPSTHWYSSACLNADTLKRCLPPTVRPALFFLRVLVRSHLGLPIGQVTGVASITEASWPEVVANLGGLVMVNKAAAPGSRVTVDVATPTPDQPGITACQFRWGCRELTSGVPVAHCLCVRQPSRSSWPVS